MDATLPRTAKIVTMMLFLVLSAAGGVAPEKSIAAPQLSSRLPGYIPAGAIAAARSIGPLARNTPISLAFALPLRNQPELDDLLKRLYSPADPLYGQFLSPDEFATRFGPLQADYDAVISYALAEGLTVTGTHPNRLLLDVSGSAGVVEAAFNLHLLSYQDSNGREFYAPDNDPEVPGSVVPLIQGIIGLDNAAVWHPHSRGLCCLAE
jgi:subtilase family serine protease